MLKYKTLSADTSSKPSLTKRPAPSGTQGASAQAGSQQGAYTQFGAQFGSQQPPRFPNPPPLRPQGQPPQQQFNQQNFGAQAAAGFPMRAQPNYHGIPKVKVNAFDGEASEYQIFKLTFHAASKAHGVTATNESEGQTSHNHF